MWWGEGAMHGVVIPQAALCLTLPPRRCGRRRGQFRGEIESRFSNLSPHLSRSVFGVKLFFPCGAVPHPQRRICHALNAPLVMVLTVTDH